MTRVKITENDEVVIRISKLGLINILERHSGLDKFMALLTAYAAGRESGVRGLEGVGIEVLSTPMFVAPAAAFIDPADDEQDEEFAKARMSGEGGPEPEEDETIVDDGEDEEYDEEELDDEDEDDEDVASR